jgi:hypothetical protein
MMTPDNANMSMSDIYPDKHERTQHRWATQVVGENANTAGNPGRGGEANQAPVKNDKRSTNVIPSSL